MAALRAGSRPSKKRKCFRTISTASSPPANNWVHQKAAVVTVSQTVHRDAAHDIPASKYPIVHRAVLDACDVLDGVKDGVLEEPRRCHFDPKELECKGADGPDCLTSAQVESARKIYAPV